MLTNEYRPKGPGRARPVRLTRPAVLAAWALSVAVSCADAPDPEPRLDHGAPTVEALAQEVWAALVASDTATLDRLRLSEREHNELVWPEQPAAAQPAAAAQLDEWWANIERRNRASLGTLLDAFAGSSLDLAGGECRGEPRRYASYEALTGCVLLLDGPAGSREVEAFRYVIRMDGVHKVVRYYGE